MKNVIAELSNKLNLPSCIIKDYYNAYWKYIKESIESFDFKQDLSIEDYNNMRVNFNIPYLGKLACTYERQQNIHKFLKKKEDAKHKESNSNG